MVDSRVWAEKIGDNPGASCSARKKGSVRKKMRHVEQKKECGVGLQQKYKINRHECTLI